MKRKTYDEALKARILKQKKDRLAKSTKPKKKRTTSLIKPLKTKLWELCKQIIRILYKNPDGTWNCYTCGAIIHEPKNAHTGHFLASSICGAFLRYDLRNLRIQDYYCNINCGGNGAIYYQKLVEREGQEYVDQIFKDKQITIKADEWWYKSKISEYEILLQNLQESNKYNL